MLANCLKWYRGRHHIFNLFGVGSRTPCEVYMQLKSDMLYQCKIMRESREFSRKNMLTNETVYIDEFYQVLLWCISGVE